MRSLYWSYALISVFVVRSIGSPAGAPIPSSVAAALTESTSQSQAQPSVTPSAVLTDTNITSIPGAWNTGCNYDDIPCIAYCSSADIECQATGNALASACAPSWNSYWDISRRYSPTVSGWYNVTSTEGSPPSTVTTTLESYTSFSTASEAFVKQYTGEEPQTTITPVYALGSPVLIETVTTFPDLIHTVTRLEGPKPTCSVLSMRAMDREDCGQCTIRGGTVDLYFWPPATSAISTTNASPPSTVVDGSTLVSPTVYIRLRKAYAINDCSVVGNEHKDTLVAVDAAQLSTQIHIGGKVAAYEYGKLDYADLTGLPPASEYQMQPSCVMFGCLTMYSTTFFPTLKVPPQIRSVDPAWSDCALGLEGLYDPPVMLEPRGAAASPTRATQASPPTATPCMTWKPVTSTAAAEPALPNASSDDEVDSTSTLTLTSRSIASTRVVSLDHPGGAAPSSADSLEGEIDSTSTLVITSHFIATTRIVSIDEPNDGEPTNSGQDPAQTTDDLEVPDSVLTPSPLPDGDGFLVNSQTLRTGDAITLGSGSSETTLSLETRASSETWLAYGTSVAIAIDPPIESSPPQLVTTVPGPDVYHVGGGTFHIGTHTLARDSTATIGRGGRRRTYSMFTYRSETLLAVGTSRTLELYDASTRKTTADDLAFTQASDGNFVLDGTTLFPGRPITIGSGADRTKLAITSFQSMPAIVIDGSVTQQLAPDPISTNSALPPVTSVSAPATSESRVASSGSDTASTSSESAGSKGATRSQILSILGAVFAFLAAE